MKPVIIEVKWLWVEGITLFPFVFVRHKDWLTLNHERIHFYQQLKYWIIPFYLIYLYDWIRYGYWGIRFELEAYDHEDDPNYKP